MLSRIICPIAFLLLTGHCLAQSPFARGTISFTNRPNLTYSNYKSLVNGDPKDFDFYLDPSYFIIDGVAAGVELRGGSNSSKSLNSSFSSWQANLTVTYARKVTSKLNAYAKLFAGPGRSNSEFNNGSVQKLKSTYFQVKGLIGMPFALNENNAAFLTPYVSYDYYKTKASSNNFTDKTLTFGFKLESYLGEGTMPEGKQREAVSNTAYNKGSHFLDFNTIGNLSFNSRQQKQVGSSVMIAKQKNTSLNLAFGYHYYVIDNIAAGINFDLSSRKSAYAGTTGSSTTRLMIQPTVTAQAPLEGNGRHLFLQAAYGFGSFKEPKKRLTELKLRAGYNLFLGKFLALTPKFGYDVIKGKVPSGVSGIAYTDKGFAAEIGVRAWLNFWKWG